MRKPSERQPMKKDKAEKIRANLRRIASALVDNIATNNDRVMAALWLREIAARGCGDLLPAPMGAPSKRIRNIHLVLLDDLLADRGIPAGFDDNSTAKKVTRASILQRVSYTSDIDGLEKILSGARHDADEYRLKLFQDLGDEVLAGFVLMNLPNSSTALKKEITELLNKPIAKTKQRLNQERLRKIRMK